MQSKTNKVKNFQSHYLLADRIQSMIRALKSKPVTSENEAAIRDLREQEANHYHQAMMTGDLFITIK